MEPINKEVETQTDATISCVITGLTRQLDEVSWTNSAGTDVTTLSGNNYVVDAGSYDSNSQTTTLTVKAAVNIADATYSCVFDSQEWATINEIAPVILNVFGN